MIQQPLKATNHLRAVRRGRLQQRLVVKFFNAGCANNLRNGQQLRTKRTGIDLNGIENEIEEEGGGVIPAMVQMGQPIPSGTQGDDCSRRYRFFVWGCFGPHPARCARHPCMLSQSESIDKNPDAVTADRLPSGPAMPRPWESRIVVGLLRTARTAA